MTPGILVLAILVLAVVVLAALCLKRSVKLDIGAWGTHVKLEAEGESKRKLS